MRYSVFEEAATEASLGVKQIDSQLEQIGAQMEELRKRKDLLERLSRQLTALATEGAVANAESAAVSEPAVSEPLVQEPAAEAAPKAELPLPQPEPEPALVGVGGTTPPGWFSRRWNSGVRTPFGQEQSLLKRPSSR